MKTKMDEKQKEALVDRVIDVLHTVYDPEIPVDVYELGLIYNIEVSDKGEVYILMTMTTPNCPMIESLPQEIEEKIKAMEGVNGVRVEVTFDPTWDKDMMSEEAKLQLGSPCPASTLKRIPPPLQPRGGQAGRGGAMPPRAPLARLHWPSFSAQPILSAAKG